MSNIRGSGDLAAAKLFIASSSTIVQRLVVAVAIAVGAAPVLPWWQPALWLAAVVATCACESFLAKRLSRPELALTSFRVFCARALIVSGSVNYAIISSLLWGTGVGVARLFAVVIVTITLLYLLMQYYSRPRIYFTSTTPLLAVAAIGVGDLVWLCFQGGRPLASVTAVMCGVALVHHFIAARGYLSNSRMALRAARAEAMERGVAAEAASHAKSAFLATMSHEIRTPLNGVLGMAQAMAAGDLTPLQRERLEVVRQSGEALFAILNDVLDLSKIEAGKMDIEDIEFDIGDLARAARLSFSGAAEARGLSLGLEISPDAEGVYRGDPTRVRQILYNFLSNAVKFTHEGHVRILVSRCSEGGVSIAVADTGEGVPPDRVANLFDKFVQADTSTTRRHGGSGLGLAICHELAALMGGVVRAESVLGQGSTFTLAAPFERVGERRVPTPEPLRVEEEGSTAAKPDRSDIRILAAEDNPMNQLVLKTLLHQAGIEPTVVENGQEALSAWRTQHWDLILMDVQMPEMDGPAAARAIRAEEAAANRPRTPIIALTANAMSHQIADYCAAGMDDHVAKPIEAARLYDAISRAMEMTEAAASSNADEAAA